MRRQDSAEHIPFSSLHHRDREINGRGWQQRELDEEGEEGAEESKWRKGRADEDVDVDVDVDVDARWGCVVCWRRRPQEGREGKRKVGIWGEWQRDRELCVISRVYRWSVFLPLDLACWSFAPMEQWRPVLALDPASVKRTRLANNAVRIK
jgi:hypothetical protein